MTHVPRLSSATRLFTLPRPNAEILWTALIAVGLWTFGHPALGPTGAVQAQTIVYVDADNDAGTEDGDSWATAYTDLESALGDVDASGSSAANTEIWIADGTYTPADGDTGSPDQGDSFTIRGSQDGLEIYGGFTGGEGSRSERDVEGNPPVILSGDLDGDDDPFAPKTDSDNDISTPTQTDHIKGGNSHHVLFLNGGYAAGADATKGIGTTTVIDGVVVTGGAATGDSFTPAENGGGLYCDGQGQSNVDNPDNGLCSPTLSGITFRGNRAVSKGGALYNNGSDNIESDGSSIDVNGGSGPTITDAVFRGNSANPSGTNAEGGAAVYNQASIGRSNPEIRDALFVNNRSGKGGGALTNSGSEGRSSPIIRNVVFKNNRSGSDLAGSAISSTTEESEFDTIIKDYESVNPRIIDAVFIGNGEASSFGGAVSFDGDGEMDAEVVNSLFIDNGRNHISFAEGTPQGDSGNPSPTIINCTFVGASDRVVNVSRYEGGAIPIAFDNSIFSNNNGDMVGTNFNVSDPDDAVIVRHSLVEETSYAEGEVHGNPGNIDGTASTVSPQFADASSPAGADGDFGTADDGLRLQGPGSEGGPSSAIDAGDNAGLPSGLSAGLAGASRRQDVSEVSDTGSGSSPIVDMGPYESDGSPLPVELAHFGATAIDGGARLTWRTSSETNNAGFELQRRKEEGWMQVGYVKSKAEGGTSAHPKSYRYDAEQLPVGTHQFRLRQVDLDGSATLSDPARVSVQMQEAVKLERPAPNPASANTALSFAVEEQVETRITLYNTLGQRVATVYDQVPPAEELKTIRLGVGKLASGTYFVRLEAGGRTRIRQLTVVR